MTTQPHKKSAPMASIVQIFEVSDAHAQELIAGLLSGVADMSVRAASRGADLLVTTACIDDIQANSVSRLVKSIDFNARLLYATNEPNRSLVA